MREEIELWRKQFGVGEPGQELPDALYIQTDNDPQQEANNCADHANRRPGDQEYAHDRTLRRTHGAQDGDVLPLVLYEHDQSRDDVKRSDEHDKRQDQEHYIAFNLKRVEKCRVALTPVDHENRTLRSVLHRLAIAIDAIRIVSIDLYSSHISCPIEIGLGFFERHENHGVVVLGHPTSEDCTDIVDLDARGGAHGRHCAARRDKRDVIARTQRELVRKSSADHNGLVLIKTLERALFDIVCDGWKLLEIHQP